MAEPAESVNQNLLPVQAFFSVDGEFQTFIGQGQPFYATVNPDQSGLHITNSTIDSTTIGATTPSTGVFSNVATTTGTIATAPSGNTDIANKLYVDSIAQGLNPKQAVKCATTADITLSGLQTIDTYTTLAGDRVLVKNQSTSSENGIYIAGSSAWTRATDMDVWSEVPGAYTVILNGDQAQTGWVSTASDTGTIGVTPMPWVQFSGSATYYAGTGLSLAANTFSITNTGVIAATKGSASKTVTAAVNAQGQLTSLTDQDIAIAGTQITSGTIDSARLSGSYTGITGVGILTAGTWNATTVDVAHGGTGATTLTGYVKGSGTSALTASSTIPNTDITGLGTMSTQDASSVAITGGSAAVNTLKTLGLTGYLYGNDTSAVSASTTIPNTAITGLGTMSTQNANNVAITGGTISGLTQLETDYIQFDTAATVTRETGRLWWDNTNGNQTLNLGMAGSNATLQIGEEMYYRIKASSDITEGQVVMFTGTVGGSGALKGAPATGLTAETASYVMGVATEDIANNQWGYVTYFGLVRGINTTGGAEAWVDGQILYYDPTTPGGLTKTIPDAPNAKIQVCAVVNAAAGGSGSLFIRPTFGGKLGQYEGDVEIVSPANNDLLVYDGGQSRWENVASTSVSIGTATNLAGGVAGAVPYQSGVGATGFTAAGTSGQVLTSQGTGAPTWTTPTAYATVTDDTTTNATRYPLFADATSGNLTTEYTSSTKYQFNPSTGVLTATSFSGAGAFTTLSASSTVSGTGFSTYLASPPAIGGAAAAAGTFTTLTATADSAFTSTGALQLPVGTTAQQPTGAAGKLRFNSTTSQFEGYTGAAWTSVGGAAITDDTTTNSTFYPLFASTTSGTATTVYTSSTKYKYNPSTGTLSAPQVAASNGIVVNSQTVASNYTIATGDNGLSAGPVTVSSGITVTISSGSVWTVV